MKVIRKPVNYIPWWADMRVTCADCGTEVAPEPKDVLRSSWRPERTEFRCEDRANPKDGKWVKVVGFDCPTCGRVVETELDVVAVRRKEAASMRSAYDEERARLSAQHRPLMSEFFMGSPSAHGPAHLLNVEGEIAILIDKICLDGGDKKLVRVIEWLISILGSSVKPGSFDVYKKVLAEMLREC